MANHDSQKPFYRWRELCSRYGAALLGRMIVAGWLVPRIKAHRFALYTADSVAAADRRLLAGELPPRRGAVSLAVNAAAKGLLTPPTS